MNFHALDLMFNLSLYSSVFLEQLRQHDFKRCQQPGVTCSLCIMKNPDQPENPTAPIEAPFA